MAASLMFQVADAFLLRDKKISEALATLTAAVTAAYEEVYSSSPELVDLRRIAFSIAGDQGYSPSDICLGRPYMPMVHSAMKTTDISGAPLQPVWALYLPMARSAKDAIDNAR